jgi:hypothetical protein
MTGWTNIENTVKRQPGTRMRAAACGFGLSLLPTNIIGDRFTHK